MPAKRRSTARWLADLGPVALALGGAVAPLQAGCGDCKGIHNCQEALYGQATVPAEFSAPITRVTADEPCSAFRSDPSSTRSVLVTVKGPIDVGETVTCHVHAELLDGTQLVASIDFRSLGGCCAQLSTAIGGPTTFTPAGGGSGG